MKSLLVIFLCKPPVVYVIFLEKNCIDLMMVTRPWQSIMLNLLICKWKKKGSK